MLSLQWLAPETLDTIPLQTQTAERYQLISRALPAMVRYSTANIYAAG